LHRLRALGSATVVVQQRSRGVKQLLQIMLAEAAAALP
jgi:hypothetical protein